jgi:hypothetical protein
MKWISIVTMLLLANRVHADDYYIWLFAYEDSQNSVEQSHTFATVERVPPSGKVAYNTISWMPASLNIQLFAPAEKGVNLSLPLTLGLAKSRGLEVVRYGPYRITSEFYDKFLLRIAQLNSGEVLYKANDGCTYPMAMNCIHAVSGINGRLNTGFSWGNDATVQVLRFFGLAVYPNSRGTSLKMM